jgi:hypothetical protein
MPELTKEQKIQYLHRYSQTLINQGFSFNEFYRTTKGTSLGTKRETLLKIYQQERENSMREQSALANYKRTPSYYEYYKYDRESGKYVEKKNFRESNQINYTNLPESKNKTLKNYSFVVQRGYQTDEDDNYIKDKKGNLIPDYVTVISDRQLTRQEIIEQAKTIPSGQNGTKGHGYKGRIRLVRAVRSIFRK